MKIIYSLIKFEITGDELASLKEDCERILIDISKKEDKRKYERLGSLCQDIKDAFHKTNTTIVTVTSMEVQISFLSLKKAYSQYFEICPKDEDRNHIAFKILMDSVFNLEILP